MNTNSFKFFALFSLVAFSPTSSYSMHKVVQPQISATALMALRHCSTGPKASQEAAQATETQFSKIRMHPEDMEELKRFIRDKRMNYKNMEELKEHIKQTRMHPEDMTEIKEHIEDNKVNYFLIFLIGWMTSAITRLVTNEFTLEEIQSDLDCIKSHQNDVSMKLHRIEKTR